ncbi:MAG: TonB-dependent receptor plug domain-containing protein, partial [Bacteroidales bacterium]
MKKFLIPLGLFLAINQSSVLANDLINENGNEAASTQQAKTILLKGVVEDAMGPIIGATVNVVGTNNGVITDFDGNYEITVSPGDVVNYAYLGYKSQEIKITDQKTLNVTLHEATQDLGEVVVTALGMKRDKKALGYAMSEVKGDALVDARESNVANALSGKVSGLQIIRSNNGVGGSSKIVLRGNSSLTGNNQPLIVVDGVPMDNFTGGVSDVWGNSGPDMGNGLSDINPDDIESMSVLKGASAAALYGSRAGNGVILITTKSGKTQDGLGITVSSGFTAETIFMAPKLQSSFGQGSVGQFNPLSNSSWGPKIEGQTITNWNGQAEQLNAYDNIDSFFGTGTSFNEGVSIQKQIDKTSLFTSINRSDDKSMVPGSKLNRTAITLRGTTVLGKNEKLKLDAKINYVNTNADNRPIQGINSSNAFYTIYNLPRSLDINQFNSPMLDANGNAIWYDKGNSPQINPWWLTEYLRNSDTRNRLLG